MEVMENAKTALSEMLEAAGESGVTDGQALVTITNQGIDYYTALKSLPDICQEIGVDRTTAPNGITFLHHKPKKEPEQQETAASKMAKKAAQSNASERKTAEIINKYRR